MGQYEKDKKELQEKIDQLEHKLKKAKQAGDQADVDKYSTSVMDCCHSGTGLDLPFTYVQGRGWSVDSLPAFSLPRTVNGTGHTGPSEFCATSI